MRRAAASALVLLLALAGVPPLAAEGEAASAPPCPQPDEMESPPWLPASRFCSGYVVEGADVLRLWVYALDTAEVKLQSAPQTVHRLCYLGTAGSIWTCESVEGPGHFVDFNIRSTTSGVLTFRIEPSYVGPPNYPPTGGGAYTFEVEVTATTPQNDCGTARDAEQAISTATLVTPYLECHGELILQDPGDLYKLHAVETGTIGVSASTADGVAEACLYPPASLTPFRCDLVGAGGVSYAEPAWVTGMWRLALRRTTIEPVAYDLVLSSTAVPSMVSVVCELDGAANRSVPCSFRATDPDASGIAYVVDWGDGSPVQRVPTSGFVAAGTTLGATHVWPAPGTYAVRVQAQDNDTPASTSPAMTLAYTLANHAPIMRSLACDPDGAANVTVTCTFHASDRDAHPVAYTIDWGDGSPTTRVPSSGHLAENLTAAAGHVWPAPGTYTLTVTAEDAHATPAHSAPRTISHLLQGRPRIEAFSCAPAPSLPTEAVTCSFRAEDDSGGIAYTLDWGDGSAPTRVPTEGHVAPGTPADLSKTFPANASLTFRLTVEDNGAPSRAATATRAHAVQANPPTMVYLSCGTGAPVGVAHSCSARATDDSPLVWYAFDWGDGTPQGRAPATGSVAPNVNTAASHTWTRPGFHTVTARATDDTIFPLTSAPRTVELAVGTKQRVTGTIPLGGFGVSERIPPVVPAPPVDGRWITLATPGVGGTVPNVQLVFGGAGTPDLDVRFYDALFLRIDSTCGATGAFVTERCVAPAGAVYAYVGARLGASNSWYEFTYLHA